MGWGKRKKIIVKVAEIKGGFLISQTQQNSDITYRVYDYGRMADEKLRELHLQQSINVIETPAKTFKDFVQSTDGLSQNKLNLLYDCAYYRIFKFVSMRWKW